MPFPHSPRNLSRAVAAFPFWRAILGRLTTPPTFTYELWRSMTATRWYTRQLFHHTCTYPDPFDSRSVSMFPLPLPSVLLLLCWLIGPGPTPTGTELVAVG